VNVPSPPETMALMEQLATFPISAMQIITMMTNHNPVLVKVKQFTFIHGWSFTLPFNLSDTGRRETNLVCKMVSFCGEAG